MSRASFWAAVVLGCYAALLTLLALRHDQRIETLEEQIVELRLQSKPLVSREPAAAAVPTPAPVPPLIEAEKPAAAVPKPGPPIKAEKPAAAPVPEPIKAEKPPAMPDELLPKPAARRAPPVDEFAGMTNAEINRECDRRGLSTDTLYKDHWRCTKE